MKPLRPLRTLLPLSLAAALGLGLMLTGCGSQDSSDGPPSLDGGGDTGGGGGLDQASVVLSADRSSATAGEVVALTAAVSDAKGRPAPAGTAVRFEASSGSFGGSGDAITVATGTGGTAAAMWTLTKAGSCSVTARALGVSSAPKAVAVSAGPAARLALTSTPTTIVANGTASATIEARYLDAYDNVVSKPDPAVAGGQRIVTFRTSLGSFQANQASTLQVTTVAGVAKTVLVGGFFGGTANVVAFDDTLSSQVSIAIVKDPLIALQVSKVKIQAGSETSTVTATAVDSSGFPVPDQDVTFTTTLGTLDGPTDKVKVVATDVAGRATVTLSGDPARPGTAFVAADATISGKRVVSSPASVLLIGSLYRLALTSTVTSARANGRDVATLEATAYDAAGNVTPTPLPGAGDGQIDITFRTDLGTFGVGGVQERTVRTAAGAATVSLVAPTAAGVATVSAWAGTLVASPLQVTFVEPPPSQVESLAVNATSSTLVADQTSRTRVTATVAGAGGVALAGVPVQFQTSAGTLLQFSEADAALGADGIVLTDGAGKAAVYLVSPQLMGSAKVTVGTGGFQKQTTIQFIAGSTAEVTLAPEFETLAADGASTTKVAVHSKDAHGNPTDDAFTVAVPDNGSVSQSVVSTLGGVGTFTYTAGRNAGSAKLTVKNASGEGDDATIQLVSLPIAAISISSDEASVPADGTSRATLTVSVEDTLGQPVAGASVSLATTFGTLSAQSVVTDATGQKTVTLQSPRTLGKATVTAKAGGRSASVDVAFVAGPPRRILVAPSTLSLVADGQQTGIIRVAVLDGTDHRVADGTLVTFALGSGDLGTLDAYSKQTSDGEVTVTYRAPDTTIGSPEAIAIAAGDAETGVGTSDGSPTVTLIGVTEQVSGVALAVASPTLLGDGVATTVVTATVTNSTGRRVADGTPVVFSVPASKGALLPGTSAATVGGAATVVYRSAVTVGPVVITADVGGITQSATVTLEAGPVAEITVTASPTRIAPDDTTVSTLLVRADDRVGLGGNPVSGTVSLSTDLGTLSANSVALVNGEGVVTLRAATGGRAHVNAGLSDVIGSTVVDVGISSAGIPANILFSFTKTMVSVKGVGGNEVTNLDVTVVDEGGNPISDEADNLTLEIVEGPGGGEELVAPPAQRGPKITLTTEAGKASAAFQGGILPGSVRIRATVTQGGDEISATAPKISVLAGPPFSVFLGRSNAIVDHHDGTLTHDYLAIVTDQYGNAVPDGTGVYFGQIANVKAEASDGEILLNVDPVGAVRKGTQFRSGSSAFSGRVAPDETLNVVRGDTLILLSGSEKGGYLLDSVPTAKTLQIFSVFELDRDDAASGIDFSVGNNFLGVNPNGTIVGAPVIPLVVATKDGMAVGANHYAGELVNTEVAIYGETAGRRVGDARKFSLGWVAPTQVTISGATEVVSGGTATFTVLVTDSSTPTPYPIPGLQATISSGAGAVSEVNPAWGRTTDEGMLTFKWTAPSVVEDKSYTLSVFAGGTEGTIGVAVKVP